MKLDPIILAFEALLALGCAVSTFSTGGLLAAVLGTVGPMMVWEAVDAFFLLFLTSITARSALFISWFFVISVLTVALIYAVAADGWVLLWFAILTGRHLLARRSGLLQAAFANTVHYVFAVFPAGFLAYVATTVLDLRFEQGVPLFAALYFSARAYYMRWWDPHRWLGVSWSPR